jgi:hypothetical protein
VTTDRRRLLQRLAFSESRHFSWDMFPANTMAYDRRVRLDAIGSSACPMALFSGFYESHEPPPSGDALGIVPPHRNGHQHGQQSGYILHCHFVDCRPGGRRGDREQLAARWQRLVAFYVALDMLHRAMPRALLQCLRMAIKMAYNGVAFVRRRCLFCLALS